MNVEIISATRHNENDFWEKSALGQSLCCMAHEPRIVTRIFYENTCGLPELYNRSIQTQDDHDVLVFMHDDIWLSDLFFVDRLLEGLDTFDIVGLAGNTRRYPGQVEWHRNSDGGFDLGFLSGVVGHGKHPMFGETTIYGPVSRHCELMDGVLLAARKSTLVSHQVGFDPRFLFHFYDLDFCRTARTRGLTLGTVAVSVSHQSSGYFDGQSWHAMRRVYLDKWGD